MFNWTHPVTTFLLVCVVCGLVALTLLVQLKYVMALFLGIVFAWNSHPLKRKNYYYYYCYLFIIVIIILLLLFFLFYYCYCYYVLLLLLLLL